MPGAHMCGGTKRTGDAQNVWHCAGVDFDDNSTSLVGNQGFHASCALSRTHDRKRQL